MFACWKLIYCYSLIFFHIKFWQRLMGKSIKIQTHLKLQDIDKFNLTHTVFSNYRGAIHPVVFKRMLSVLADKSLITGIFNSLENNPWIKSWHTDSIPKVKCPPKRNSANVLQMKVFIVTFLNLPSGITTYSLVLIQSEFQALRVKIIDILILSANTVMLHLIDDEENIFFKSCNLSSLPSSCVLQMISRCFSIG